MFTLVTGKSFFYRVKRGQSAADIERVLKIPCDNVFRGEIIAANVEYAVYGVQPCESYRSLSKKFGVEEEVLKSVNFSRPLYPTQKVFVPLYVRT